jgi:hypothetical protein
LFRAKRLEFHRSLECLELVTEIAQPLQSIIDIEKSRLPSHRIISDPSVTMESERRRIGEVLRSIQLCPLSETRVKASPQAGRLFQDSRRPPAGPSFGFRLPCSWRSGAAQLHRKPDWRRVRVIRGAFV